MDKEITPEVEVAPVKRGRKPKYTTEEERKAAKRAQNRAYRERKKQELIELRRLNAQLEAKQQAKILAEDNSE